MKSIGRKVAIDSSKFVNIDTGELLVDVFGGEVGSVNIRTDFVRVDYIEYFSINIKALEYLRTRFSDGEMGRILAMCGMIRRTEYNALHSRTTNKLHTKQTLVKELGVHKNTFDPFLKKLIDNSVLYLLTGVVKRRKVVSFILNPTLACQNRNFPKSRTELFEDFNKKEYSFKDKLKKFEQVKIEQQ